MIENIASIKYYVAVLFFLIYFIQLQLNVLAVLSLKVTSEHRTPLPSRHFVSKLKIREGGSFLVKLNP